jgi:hypothetical protein
LGNKLNLVVVMDIRLPLTTDVPIFRGVVDGDYVTRRTMEAINE